MTLLNHPYIEDVLAVPLTNGAPLGDYLRVLGVSPERVQELVHEEITHLQRVGREPTAVAVGVGLAADLERVLRESNA